ncbi:MAG: peptide chain release factor 2 [Candidatus Marinimicrobia bacterium]|nr:peptide chain release factor 2 [Candidatus Neomarinimicrobiota bacterium]
MKSGGIFDNEKASNEISKLQEKTRKVGFWDNNKLAQEILKTISILENEQKMWKSLDELYENLELHFELIDIGEEPEKSLIIELNKFKKELDQAEILTILNGPDDSKDAIVTIHPGAGGTESQDWAQMLYRLYTRWCEQNNFKIKVINFQSGDEAGIKDVSFEVSGPFAYGHLTVEAGVHRLVRISPFDTNGKRHTSFASIFVYPILDDDIEIEILDKDLRVETYRASGAGGQHVNKTDSAVRITHIPTNIVAQCQNERSQLKNRKTVMKMLKAKLYQKKQNELAKEKNTVEEQKMDIAWGSQIRSYVFHPYNMVKDHRTNIETGNIQSVMDGNIDFFIRGYLLKKMENSQIVK